jgi:molybdate-binding protein/DNA-binding XRE family transcriptional regulator
LALRERLHLSQVELARRAGLTRQAVNSIERGLSVPAVTTALRLAEVLDCPVTALFQKSEPEETLSVDLPDGVNFSENRVHLAEVGGRWIAIPSQASQMDAFDEASGRLISREGSRGEVKLLAAADQLRRNLLVAGCDPALGILRNLWNRTPEGGIFCWQNLSSTAAVHALQRGEAHVAGVHFPNPETQRHAIALLPMEVIVVRFARWEQGWMLSRGNPLQFRSEEDLISPRVRLINRNEGAGSRLLLDELLEKTGIPAGGIPGYAKSASSHFACARAIREGTADIAIGLRAVAESCSLDFLPIQEVGFNLIIPRVLLDFPPVARMLNLLQHQKFHRQLTDLPGYETTETGKVLTLD